MSYSQIGQDLWVNSILENKKNGYFVELGACDGLHLSNTLYFEKHFEWNGICIEPNDIYFQKLKENRKCNISNSLIYSKSGELVDFSISEAASGIVDENIGPFTRKDVIIKKNYRNFGKCP